MGVNIVGEDLIPAQKGKQKPQISHENSRVIARKQVQTQFFDLGDQGKSDWLVGSHLNEKVESGTPPSNA